MPKFVDNAGIGPETRADRRALNGVWDAIAQPFDQGANGTLSVGDFSVPATLGGSVFGFGPVTLTCVTAPQGADLVVDALLSTDGGSHYASIFTVSPKPRIAAGATSGGPFPPDIDSAVPGSLFKWTITQVGSSVAGASLTASMQGGPF